MKILLISPYDAMSHQYWHQGLRSLLPEHEFVLETLPPRYFSWRVRGNSLTLSHRDLPADRDVLIATSMTDLSALRGMKPELTEVPNILYFHENQFAYPDAGESAHLVERQITSIYSAIAADHLVFNSTFNQESFLRGAGALLKKLPDGVPDGVIAALQDKSRVIPVPVTPVVQLQKASPAQIVWNHRWEHDKGLEKLLSICRDLVRISGDFKFHLIGQGFRETPVQIKIARQLLTSRGALGEFGFIEDKNRYHELLGQAHVVLSTAHHEFQGIAVLEAMSAGCEPLVPDDLAYREFVPPQYRYGKSSDALKRLQQIVDDPASATSCSLPDRVKPAMVESEWQELLRDLL